MIFKFTYVSFLATVLGIGVSTIGLAQETRQTEQSISIVTRLDYLLYLPDGYKKDSNTKWPLMVFLHGSGERGNDLDRVKKWGPPKMVESGRSFPFILVSPQCPSDRRWNAEHLKQLLDQVIKNHDVDRQRIYLTGLSMGGFGTWDLASRYPEFFAAIAPICGGGDPTIADSLLTMPIWAFHGETDQVVPLSQTTNIIDAIKAKGGDKVKLTVFEGVGHNSWTPAFADPELFEWFLSHRRK